MISQPLAVQTKKLAKRYAHNQHYSLRELDLAIPEGEVYGYLGPNGAGKSTTIRLLLRFIQPTTGSAELLGQPNQADAAAIKRDIGYATGDSSLIDKLTGRQLLAFLADLRGNVRPSYQKELAKRFKADLNKPIGSLSRGNKQKIALIQAFAHQPKLLILDEPTSGLDPLMQEVFYDLVHEAKTRQATVFMSSHILGEVQKICDRVGIIRDGELVTERMISDLASQASQTFDIAFAGSPPLVALQKLEGAKAVTQGKDGLVTVRLHGPVNDLLSLLAKSNVTQLRTHELDLEQEFLHFYETEVRS